jgi:hypothetical protein
MTCYIPGRWSPSTFPHWSSGGILGSKVSTETWAGRGGPIIRSPRSSDLILHDSSFSGYINDTVYVPPLPNTFRKLLGGYDLLWLQLHPPRLQMCDLNLNTDMVCAWLFMAPSLNTCRVNCRSKISENLSLLQDV